MSVTKKKLLIIVGIVALAIVAISFGYWLGGGGTTSSSEQSSGVGASTGLPGTPASSTSPGIPAVAAVPPNTSVPDEGATDAPPDVAVPVTQSAGNPAGTVSYRSFNISIDDGAYDPSTVIVKQGDTVNLELTAVDANYEFTQPNYGFNDSIMKGETQTIQFQALRSGDFTFYCESCGGPSKGPVGHLIVTAD